MNELDKKHAETKRINGLLKKLQSTPCQWCQKTSEQIDSLEFELEAKDKVISNLIDTLEKGVGEITNEAHAFGYMVAVKVMVKLLTKGAE